MKYRLRLIWAYKDLLRNHFPLVTRWYVKRFRKSQMAAAQRLQGKQRIEVAFFLTIPGMWKSDYLFRAMRDNPRYHPYVVIYPYSIYKGFKRQEVEETLRRTEKFIADKGFEYHIPYDSRSGRWQDIRRTLNPDIVIFSAPYKDSLPRYFVYHFRDRLTCYVPYGFISLELSKINYDLIFHNLVGLHFVETELHKHMAAEFGRNGGVNAVVTGYVGTEVFLRSDYQPSYEWKPQSKPKKKVIWAPHHTIDNAIEGSTFLSMCDEMLLLAGKYRDQIQFVFKPHPLLKFKLQLLWGQEKTDAYYAKWALGENSQLEESNYVDLFLTSDAMIHDSGSFTTEYLFTQKPVMYLTDEKVAGKRFGPFGIKSYECHYHGASCDAVEDFLSRVVIGGDDPMKGQRQAFFDKYLRPVDGMMPSERIIYEIERFIRSDRSLNESVNNPK